MEASPTQKDSPLHAELTKISRDSGGYSPAGLAAEVARAIDHAHPECMGAFAHLADALICYEGERPGFFRVLDDLGHAATARAAEDDDRRVAEEARALPDGALAWLVRDAQGK